MSYLYTQRIREETKFLSKPKKNTEAGRQRTFLAQVRFYRNNLSLFVTLKLSCRHFLAQDTLQRKKYIFQIFCYISLLIFENGSIISWFPLNIPKINNLVLLYHFTLLTEFIAQHNYLKIWNNCFMPGSSLYETVQHQLMTYPSKHFLLLNYTEKSKLILCSCLIGG